MYADNEFLLAFSSKLQEIHDECSDWETNRKLEEFIDMIHKQVGIID